MFLLSLQALVVGQLCKSTKHSSTESDGFCFCRVKEDPTAFKVTEIAQIGRACMRIKFQNRRLSAALAENILALPDAELNPRAVLNILSASTRMGLTNQQVACRLVRPLVTTCSCDAICRLYAMASCCSALPRR